MRWSENFNRKVCGRAVGLLLLALVLAAGNATRFPARTDWVREAGERVPEVSWVKVRTWTDVLWVDARSVTQYETGHVPGAVWLGEEAFEAEFPQLLQRWNPKHPTVVYCQKGGCQASQSLARRLRAAGIAPIYVLQGGWE
jgi:rhodanese-related sulfurtransferase